MSLRPIKSVLQAKPTLEGAGVRLRRAFGFGRTSELDPFLLLDDFRNEHPEDYLAGFPWHPHRGIETITYVLAGTVEHGDSLGNKGKLGAGDVQWMTAGRGIMHQEMPKGDPSGRMHGFQLWANLPASLKMTAPRYQDIAAADIPEGMRAGFWGRFLFWRQQAQFAYAGMRQQQFDEHARRPAAAGELGVEVGMPAGQHSLGRARHLVGAPQRRMEVFRCLRHRVPLFRGLQDGKDRPRTGASSR